jgi:hypothetical protein
VAETKVLAREYSLVARARLLCHHDWVGMVEDTAVRRVSAEAGFRTSEA